MKKINSNQKTTQREDTKQNEIIRIQKKQNNFVMLDKAFIDDERLSFKAKGILTYLLSKPDNWKVIVKDLINHSADGRDSIYSGLRELKKHGYYVKQPIRNEYGIIESWESVIYEAPNEQRGKETPSTKKNSEKTPISPPLTGFPDTGFPDTGYPDTEKPLRNNIYHTNNDSTEDLSINREEKTETLVEQPATLIDTIDTNSEIKVLTKADLAEKIGLADLKNKNPDNIEDLDIIFDVLSDILTNNNALTSTVRISKQNIPFATVNAQFQKLEQKHIEYVLQSLNNNGNKIKINKNVKSYVMTALFHSPRTISLYFDRSFSQKPSEEKRYGGLTLEEMLERRTRRTLNL